MVLRICASSFDWLETKREIPDYLRQEFFRHATGQLKVLTEAYPDWAEPLEKAREVFEELDLVFQRGSFEGAFVDPTQVPKVRAGLMRTANTLMVIEKEKEVWHR